MALSRIRRVQLPLLPAEYVWRRRLRLQTSSFSTQLLHHHRTRLYSLLGSHIRTQSLSPLDIRNENGVGSGGNRTVSTSAIALHDHPGLVYDSRLNSEHDDPDEDPFAELADQHANLTDPYSHKKRMRHLIEQKMQAQGMSRWSGRGKQSSKSWKVTVLRKKMERELEYQESEGLEEEDPQAARRKRRLMLRQYFPDHKSKSATFVPLPQFKRGGSGVDDIYLYQLLWKATGQVNEVKRRLKASNKIYVRLEKFRMAQLAKRRRHFRMLGREEDLKRRITNRLGKISAEMKAGRMRREKELVELEKRHEWERMRLEEARAKSPEGLGRVVEETKNGEGSTTRDYPISMVLGNPEKDTWGDGHIERVVVSGRAAPEAESAEVVPRIRTVAQSRWNDFETTVGQPHIIKTEVRQASSKPKTLQEPPAKPEIRQVLSKPEINFLQPEEEPKTESHPKRVERPFGDFKKFLNLGEDYPTGAPSFEKDAASSSPIDSLYEMALNLPKQSSTSSSKSLESRQREFLKDKDDDPFLKPNQEAKASGYRAGKMMSSEAKPLPHGARRPFVGPYTQSTGRYQSVRARSTVAWKARLKEEIREDEGSMSESQDSEVSYDLGGVEIESPGIKLPKPDAGGIAELLESLNVKGSLNFNPPSREPASVPPVGSLRDRLKDKLKADPSILTTPLPEKSGWGKMQDRFVSRSHATTGSQAAYGQGESSEGVFDTDLTSTNFVDTRDPSGMTGVSRINPGSIVEVTLRPGVAPVFGVAIQKSRTKADDYFFIMAGGQVKEFSGRFCFYVMPEFVSEETIEEIITATKSTGEVPRHLLVDVSSRIRQFELDCKKVLLSNAPILKSIASKVCLDKEVQQLSLTEVARIVYNGREPSEWQKYAVHVYMMQDKQRFHTDTRYHSSTQLWEIKPKTWTRNFDLVSGWIREHNPHINSFAKKAREVVDIYRKEKEAHTFTSESSSKPLRVFELKDITWTPEDKEILKFLDEALRSRISAISLFGPFYPVILRLVNRAKWNKYDAVALGVFLEEVGVKVPWEDESISRRNYSLPGHHDNYKYVESRHDDAFANYDEGKEGFINFTQKMKDSMAELRHDWGDLTVYCIDSKTAEEIDDGLSIEKVPGSEDEIWLRVHVANPSAFIPLDHELTQIARQKIQAIYLCQRSYPMLPSSITHNYFSLAPGRPVLTFSLRMNSRTGKVLEHNIRPGTVHNVKRITYSQIDRLFNGDVNIADRLFTNRPPHLREELLRTLEEESHREWSEEERSDLDLLYNSMVANLRLRCGQGLASPGFPRLDVFVSDGEGNPLAPGDKLSDADHPTIRVGSPYIDTSFEPRMYDSTRPEFVVVSSMMLACHVAGDWLAKRGIPAPYRALTRIWDNKESEDLWKEYIKHSRNDLGTVIDQRIDSILPNEGIPELSPVPKRHDVLGFQTYVKATSPLRRYTDMLTHYVLEHELLNETLPEHERKPPLFDLIAMSDECKYIGPKERTNTLTQGSSMKYWTAQLFGELYRSGDPSLPKVLMIQIQTLDEWPKHPSGAALGWPLSNVKVVLPSQEVYAELKLGDIVYARFSDDMLEYNEARTVSYMMEYVGRKISVDETREQFIADVELRKNGKQEVSQWPVLTESDIAEAEAIGKNFPESKFVQQRRERLEMKDRKVEKAVGKVSPNVIVADDEHDPLLGAVKDAELDKKKKAAAQEVQKRIILIRDDALSNKKSATKSMKQLKKDALKPGRRGPVDAEDEKVNRKDKGNEKRSRDAKAQEEKVQKEKVQEVMVEEEKAVDENGKEVVPTWSEKFKAKKKQKKEERKKHPQQNSKSVSKEEEPVEEVISEASAEKKAKRKIKPQQKSEKVQEEVKADDEALSELLPKKPKPFLSPEDEARAALLKEKKRAKMRAKKLKKRAEIETKKAKGLARELERENKEKADERLENKTTE